MIFRCTNDTLKTLGLQAMSYQEEDLFLQWTVKVHKTKGVTLLVMINNYSRFVVIRRLPRARKNIDWQMFMVEGLRESFRSYGFDPEGMGAYFNYRPAGGFAKTGNRKQVSALNRVCLEIDYLLDLVDKNSDHQRDLSHQFNNSIIKNDQGVYLQPYKITKNYLLRRFGQNKITYNREDIKSIMFHKPGKSPFYLRISDGAIIEKKGFSVFDIREEMDQDHCLIVGQTLSFLPMFKAFMKDQTNEIFTRAYLSVEKGSGIGKRYEDLLASYPRVLEAFEAYMEAYKDQEVDQWLRDNGLIV